MQGVILAVGRGEQKLVLQDGALATVTQMTASLSGDQRAVSAEAMATWLQAFERLLGSDIQRL